MPAPVEERAQEFGWTLCFWDAYSWDGVFGGEYPGSGEGIEGSPHGYQHRGMEQLAAGSAGKVNSNSFPPWIRRTGIEVAGWTLIALGLVALVLPGPGLLGLVAGLAVLSLRYRWANRLLRPVKAKAFKAAEQGVQTWLRISISVTGALLVMATGVVWGVWTRAPHWWPYSRSLWLPGGWGTGTGLIISGLIALALIAYSYRRFRGTRSARRAKSTDLT